MYGTEKSAYKDISILKTSPRSYCMVLEQTFSSSKHDPQYKHQDPITGKVMVLGQLTWLIYKGDLLPTDTPRTEQWEFEFNFKDGGVRRLDLPLYEHLYDDDSLPHNFDICDEGKSWAYFK